MGRMGIAGTDKAVGAGLPFIDNERAGSSESSGAGRYERPVRPPARSSADALAPGSGDWSWPPPPFHESSIRLPTPVIHPKGVPLELQYHVGGNQVDHDFAGWPSFHTLLARWTIPDREVVGWAKLSLLGCSQSDVDAPNEDITYALLVAGTPEASQFGLLLATTCGQPVAQAFAYGRHLASFDRLELRRDCRGQGLGAPLARHLLSVVQQDFSVVLFVLRPPPLMDDVDAGYARYRASIARFAEKGLGARPLSGTGGHQAVLGVQGRLSIEGNGRCWWLQL